MRPNDVEPTSEWYNSIQQTSDGGYIASVRLQTDPQDFCIDKLDENGYRSWQKRLGGIAQDESVVVRQTADGGYVVAGFSFSFTHGSADYLVYKLNSNGQKQWRKNYGGSYSDYLSSLDLTSDEGYILAGRSYSYTNGEQDALVYKINAKGQKQWRKNYGGIHHDHGNGIKQTSDQGYFLIGSTWSYPSGTVNMLVYKLAPNGKKQWRKIFGGLGIEYGYDVIEITQ